MGGYDRGRPLVIDPAMLVYAGFIGGSGDETANNVDLDGAGNAYVTGTTTSTDFPATAGPDTTANGGLNDGYVAKVNADGSGLAYAAYIGGSDFDEPINVAVGGDGAAYVGGSTGSSESEGFPAWSGGGVLATATGPSFSTSAKLPNAAPGIYYIKATARDADGAVVGSASRAFQVTDPAPAPSAAPQPGATAPPAAGARPSEQVTSGREGNKRQSAQPQKAAPRPHPKQTVTTRSGARVFAGSVAGTSRSEPSAARATTTSKARGDSGRKAGSPRSDRGPAARNATGDLWSGFSPAPAAPASWGAALRPRRRAPSSCPVSPYSD